MKLGVLLNGKEALEKLYNLETNGAVALKLRRELNKINDETKSFEEIKNGFIQKHGISEGEKISINKDSEKWPELMNLIDEMANSEIDVKIEPVLTEEVISAGKFSAQDLDQLISIGLVEMSD